MNNIMKLKKTFSFNRYFTPIFVGVFSYIILLCFSSVSIINYNYDGLNHTLKEISTISNQPIIANGEDFHQKFTIVKDPIKKIITINMNKEESIKSLTTYVLFPYISNNKESIIKLTLNNKNIPINNILPIGISKELTSTSSIEIENVDVENHLINKEIDSSKNNTFVIYYK